VRDGDAIADPGTLERFALEQALLGRVGIDVDRLG
jgi:hypothetical protein